MKIEFKKSEVYIRVDENREAVRFEADNEQGYGVSAVVGYDRYESKPYGDGIITPIEKDVTYSGFEFIRFNATFINSETDEERDLTDEETEAIQSEVLDWVKYEMQ